ncbi:MAG: ATP-binding cassette domain-containing protein, partial [Mesorhizobium sp.]
MATSSNDSPALLDIAEVSKSFGPVEVLRSVSLQVAKGEVVTVIGPSGSGKTTLLRQIAGFDFPDAGRIAIGGESVERVPVEKRRIGMVFQ